MWVAQVYWVSSLPFFLLLAAFTPIVEMREGYPRVTLLIALGFASVLAQSGIILMTTLGGPHPSWQQAGLGALDLLGAIVVTASARHVQWCVAPPIPRVETLTTARQSSFQLRGIAY